MTIYFAENASAPAVLGLIDAHRMSDDLKQAGELTMAAVLDTAIREAVASSAS